jgi:flagellar M-ring protein FliF
MRDEITSRLQSLQRAFASFTAGQKTIAVIGGLALVLGAVMVFRWASAPSYAPLFTNMQPADASAVVDKLAADGTPYKLTDGGNTVEVPQNDVYDARIKLSGEGLPSQASEGYGLLDKQSLSSSQAQQDVMFKRATEGELEKTIGALDSVDGAIVHIAMPQQQLFATDQQPTTASVLVQEHPGATLSNEQVQAVVHLVASSVTGLDPKNVTVTDSAGDVLSAAGDTVDSVANTRNQEVQAFEQQEQNAVQSILDRIVGPGNSRVLVTADLDFDKTLTNTTRYFNTPKNVALRASSDVEKYKGTATSTAGGVVGPDGQLDPNATSSTTTPKGSGYSHTQKTSDNAVDTVHEQREAAPGGVKSLHVAVAVDTQSLHGITPNQIQSMIDSGLGINTKRGDQSTVETMPCDTTQAKAAAAALAASQKAAAKSTMMSNIKTGGLALVVLAGLLLAWLRGRKRRKARDEATQYVVEQIRRKNEPAPLPPAPAAVELEAGDPAHLRAAARDEIAAMVERQPEEVAQLLRGWLVEADS